MDEVWIKGLDANATMELVRLLRSKGLVQGRDFEFKYQPARWLDITYESQEPYFPQYEKGAYFYFKDSKWSTFFRIKHVGQ